VAIALKAIGFYTDFANPIKEVHSWSDAIDISPTERTAFQRFKDGRIAFFFGYPYHIKQLDSNWYTKKNTDPRPDAVWFDIAPMPQITQDTVDPNGNKTQTINNPVNFADYWVMTISHKTKNKDTAWGFIDFATRQKNVKLYLSKSNKPTALRAYFEEQANTNPSVSVFAKQILSARSWYHGKEYDLAKQYIKDMIDQLRTTSMDIKIQQKLLKDTSTKINQGIK